MKALHTKNKVSIAVALVAIAFLERVVFDLGPNIELVTVTMLLATTYLGWRYSAGVVLSTMLLSDIFLGNTNIFVFTWSGFLIPALLLNATLNRERPFTNIRKGTMAGVTTSIFFYLWTNFGVWVLGTMYPHTTAGLLESYMMGIPFLKLNLISSMLIVPTGFAIAESVRFTMPFIISRFSTQPLLHRH